jgi:hypothetical protein
MHQVLADCFLVRIEYVTANSESNIHDMAIDLLIAALETWPLRSSFRFLAYVFVYDSFPTPVYYCMPSIVSTDVVFCDEIEVLMPFLVILGSQKLSPLTLEYQIISESHPALAGYCKPRISKRFIKIMAMLSAAWVAFSLMP